MTVNLNNENSILKSISDNWMEFLSDETGSAAIEYGLIASLLSVAMITGATSLGSNIDEKFRNLASLMDGPPEPATANAQPG